VGQPLPASWIDDELAAHYVARYIADAQPMDGFRFDDPPLTIVLTTGPFADLDAKGVNPDPPIDKLRGKAVAAVKRGVTIRKVMIHGKGPATATGLGVGSALAQLQAAHADLRVGPIPPTLGNDECAADIASMPGVVFLFTTCAKAKAGDPATRVDVWLPE
jgi:hypothetical protein